MTTPASHNVEKMAAAATKVDDAVRELEGILTRIRGHKDELLTSGWQGESARAFGGVYTRWDAEFVRDVLGKLRALHGNLQATGRTYTAATEAQAASLSHVDRSINY